MTCPDCHHTYSRNAGHCRGGKYEGCCKSFASNGGFDRHRTGSISKGTRRCKTTSELHAEGWTQDHHGHWRTPPPATTPPNWHNRPVKQPPPDRGATEPPQLDPNPTPPNSEPPRATRQP